MNPNIPLSELKKIIIVGAGFAGLSLAKKLASSNNFQIILIDKNNYHQFQPLFYQVATGGLEPSSIAFPLRKIFHHCENVHIRVAEVIAVNSEEKHIETTIGSISYDYLVLAMGADTNYFGNTKMEELCIPMKSISEALYLRNKILQNFENAILAQNQDERDGLMNVVVVGGGATGVEISGTLAEMKTTVLPKDYPELDFNSMNIYLLEGSPKVLGAMSEEASQKSKLFLEKLGVKVRVNTRVKDFDGKNVFLGDDTSIRTNNVIWAAGIIANSIKGINSTSIGRGNRLLVDSYNKVIGYDSIFALGDLALMNSDKYPNGHPQMAQPAIQQGNLLAKNLLLLSQNKEMKPFVYNDLGSMATVGRNLAVVDLPFWKSQGFIAWLIWMFVHLMSILGIKNRLLIFINWFWNYITYDQSLRLLFVPKKDKKHSVDV